MKHKLILFLFKKKRSKIKYDLPIIVRNGRTINIENIQFILLNIFNVGLVSDFQKSLFLNFLKLETSSECKFNGDILNIKGKYQSNEISKLIDKFIKKYILCPICKSNKTEIIKVSKIQKIKCLHCTAINSL